MIIRLLPFTLLLACFPQPPQINVEVNIERTNGLDTAEDEDEDEDEDGLSAPDRPGVPGVLGDVEGCEPCALYCECELEATGLDQCSIGEECSEACLSEGVGDLWMECMEGQSLSSCGAVLDGRACGEPVFR